MAGTYNAGVPDPADSTTADPTGGLGGITNFDDLTQFGVSPAIANIPVPFTKRIVPKKDTVAPGREGGTPITIDEHIERDPVSYQQAVQALYGLKPEQVGSLQQQLVAGGFFGKNPDFVANSPDKKTYGVWNDVLKEAMRSGITPEEVIQNAIDSNGGLEEGLKKFGDRAPGTLSDVHVMHPDDIRMVAKQVSTKVLGRGWNNEQLDNFVHTYQAMQTAAGRAAQGSGASVTDAPSVENEAEMEARRQNPTAAGATDADNIMGMVMKSFSTLGGG